MVEIKTQKNGANVYDFINLVENKTRRDDALILLDMFTQITKLKPVLWGDSIIGFGEYHYKSTRSKQEGDWPLTGFSPRKANLSLYVMKGFDNYQDLLSQLGKYKTSVSCLYINKLADVDLDVLKKLIKKSFLDMKANPTYG